MGNLSKGVFERRKSTGGDLFRFLSSSFAQIFSEIVSRSVKKLSNTNFIASRHIKRETFSLPVDVRLSKTHLLKLPSYVYAGSYIVICRELLETPKME